VDLFQDVNKPLLQKAIADNIRFRISFKLEEDIQ
jgi:hypothetical protein